ncbi:MAG: threonine synthase [Aquisalinus sp.]|nr:threonine synthase [Aquisalinus sp.]
MRYHSTRGQDMGRSFTDVLLQGLASDGGLFLPESWPQLSVEQITAFAGRPYADVAHEVILPFVSDEISSETLGQMCTAAYSRFKHPATAPLIQVGNEDWILELAHGPTLAFKDFAMLLLGQLFEHVLSQRNERLTIVGATSGDTGAAAIEALRGLRNVTVFILHPEGRVSDTQRRMMTCVREDNIHNIAVQGTFDDCQALVKAMFADETFRRDIRLGAINSINWARIMAQAVYYFTSSVSLGGPARRMSYVVPTGNFGDIFAGYVAARMGLPVDKLCIATNLNDILVRTLSTGRYEPQETHKTISPSMDIQVSSNFERLVSEALGRDHAAVATLMNDLKVNGNFTLSENVLSFIRDGFAAYAADEAESRDMMAQISSVTGQLIDPHTAVGLVAAGKARAAGEATGPMVTLSTAHPAKFPDVVEEATGTRPSLPTGLEDLFNREEFLKVLPNDLEVMKQHIRSVA